MIILYLLCAILICFMIEYAVLCNSLKKAAYPAKKDGSVSPILRERINKAAKIYHEGIAEVIICTGAAVDNNYVEADVIAQTLIELGVPDCSIIREKLAKGTYENLVNSKKIMKDRVLRTAVIVSSPWQVFHE